MSSWAEEKWDQNRSFFREEDGYMYWQDVSRLTEVEGEWHCHLCADGGLTPWPPGTECPNYPCQAFQVPKAE